MNLGFAEPGKKKHALQSSGTLADSFASFATFWQRADTGDRESIVHNILWALHRHLASLIWLMQGKYVPVIL